MADSKNDPPSLPRAETLRKPRFWRAKASAIRLRRAIGAIRPGLRKRELAGALVYDILISASVIVLCLYFAVGWFGYGRHGRPAFVETAADCRIEGGTIPKVTHAVPQTDGGIWLGLSGNAPYDYTRAYTLPAQWHAIVRSDAPRGAGRADLLTSWDGQTCHYQAVIHLPSE